MPSTPVILITALALAQPVLMSVADAHAVVTESTPAVGAVVAASDADVTLHFSCRVDHRRSRLTLISPDGRVGSLMIASGSAPDVVAAKISGLDPGQYRLRWQVLAIDGHLSRGDIPFSVKAS